MSKERPDETEKQELGNPGAPECPACKVRSNTAFCPYCGKRLKPPGHGEFLANHCRSNVKRLETQAKNQRDMAAGAPANKMDKDECAEKADRYLHLAEQWEARAMWVENIIRQRVNAPLFEGPPKGQRAHSVDDECDYGDGPMPPPRTADKGSAKDTYSTPETREADEPGEI